MAVGYWKGVSALTRTGQDWTPQSGIGTLVSEEGRLAAVCRRGLGLHVDGARARMVRARIRMVEETLPWCILASSTLYFIGWCNLVYLSACLP